MGKLIFHRNSTTSERGSVVLRVRPSVYTIIDNIAKESGIPILEVASRMLEEQSKETVVVD